MPVDYYERHAGRFFRDTVGVDMAPLHDRFLAHVRPGGRVLDAGCGSGRDARAFVERGYEVVAFDASAAMARLASAHLGRPVLRLRFEEMTWREAFDGIWCCASLLHVPRAGLPALVPRFAAALRPGGVWYLSFKLGRGERIEGDRLFTDQDEATLVALLTAHRGLEVVDVWRSADRRPERPRAWLNGLARRADRRTVGQPA